MSIELKTLIEDGNKIIEALRTDVKASDDKIAKMEAALASNIEAKSALEARLSAVETASARPSSVKTSEITDEHKNAFLNYMRKTDNTEAKAALQAIEAKGIAIGTSAGNAVPTVIGAEIGTQVLNFSPIRNLARVVSVSNENYSELLATNVASGWSDETTARGETTAPTFTKIQPKFGEVYASVVVSNHALNDVFFDLEGFITMEAARQFASAEGTAFVSGDGTNKPAGLLNGTTVTSIASGVAGGFAVNAFDNLVDLRYSIKAEYAQNASFLMNSGTLSTLAKVKDSAGNYIYTPSMAIGVPDTMLGKALFVDENMPNVGAGAKAVLFGDMARAYLIADLVGLSMIVDNVTVKGSTIFYISKRVGGAVKDAAAVKALRIAVS